MLWKNTKERNIVEISCLLLPIKFLSPNCPPEHMFFKKIYVTEKLVKSYSKLLIDQLRRKPKENRSVTIETKYSIRIKVNMNDTDD